MYRGVFLYGGSGSGKSSLINAGLIPAVEEEGFRADRIRVQPRLGDEFVVERIAKTDDNGSFLPSSFAAESEDSAQLVLGADELRSRLAALGPEAREHRPLLILDQFEELVTLFEEAPHGKELEQALACQRRIVDAVIDLLQDTTLPVKLVFGFREDYLAKVRKLLERSPELVSQSLLLTPPAVDALPRLIRGPFEDHPGWFDRELSPELATQLADAVLRHTGAGSINLTELQIVCLRLWESSDPERLLEEKGIQGLLEDYLEESLNRFPAELHYPAVALLSQMVTATGVRNVVSADDLVERVRSEETAIPKERLEEALDALEKETKLVRRERRRELDLFEISSEFLVPWIGRQRADRLRAREQARLAQELEETRRRQRARLIQRLGLVISGLFVLVAVFAGLTAWKWHTASNERDESRSQVSSNEAVQLLASDPMQSVVTAYKAYTLDEGNAEEALRSALLASHRRALLSGHGDVLTGADFSPDGTRVVTSSGDGTVRFWDAASGTEIARLPKRAGAAYRAIFTPDGRRLLTARAAGVQIWDVDERRPLTRLDQADGTVAAFSPDGKLLVTRSLSGALLLWDAATWRVLRKFETPGGTVAFAAFSPDGKRVVTSSVDGKVRVWSVASPTRPAILLETSSAAYAAAFSPDGRYIVTAGHDGRARIWEVGKRRIVRTVGGQEGALSAAVFSPDGLLVATASAEGTARLWNASTGAPVAVFRGHRGPIVSAAFSPDGSRLVTASVDTTGRVWDTGVAVGVRLLSHTGKLTSAAFSPDGSALAVVAGDNNEAYVWSRGSHWTRRRLPGIGVNAVNFSPDGQFVATAAGDGKARFWSAVTGREARSLSDTGPLQSVEYDPRGERILTAGAGATIWELDSHPRRTTLIKAAPSFQGTAESPVVSSAFDPDGNRVVTVQDQVTMWNVDGTALASLPPDDRRPVDAAISRADRVVVGYSDGTATIWSVEDVSNPRRVADLVGHTKSIDNVALSGDEKFIFTTSDDRTARVWEAQSGRLLLTLRDPDGSFAGAMLSDRYTRDGALALVTASRAGSVRLYRCDACRPIDELIKLGNWDDVLAGDAPR